MMRRIYVVIENIGMRVKTIVKTRFIHELISIMMNEGRVHRDLGYFSRCSSNSIKLTDELR